MRELSAFVTNEFQLLKSSRVKQNSLFYFLADRHNPGFNLFHQAHNQVEPSSLSSFTLPMFHLGENENTSLLVLVNNVFVERILILFS